MKLVAEKDLKACFWKQGIVAGNHHFTDYWARDGFFAALGALAIDEVEIVEKTVKLFFGHQRDDGLIPYRIMNGPVTLGKYFGRPKHYQNPKPTYRLRGWGPEIMDGATMTLWLWGELKLRGKKMDQYQEQVKKALVYIRTRESQGLLGDGIMSEWNDAVYKFGNLLYSNIIYYQCLKRVGQTNKALEIGRQIRQKLWNGRFLADWVDYKRQDYLNSFGNLLAIVFGLTTTKESESIMREIEKIRVGFTFETKFPIYPWWRIDILNHLTGTADYQNQGILWWQPAIAYLAASKKMGNKKQYDQQLRLIEKQVKKYDGFHECYERTGKPVKRFLYQAEYPFAWASGMFLWACTKKGEI